MVQTYSDPNPGEVLAFIESKGFEYKERGEEIMFPCLNGCDDDDRESEKYHCSINTTTGQYHCFKCEAKGNLLTLKRLFGDSGERKTIMSNETAKAETTTKTNKSTNLDNKSLNTAVRNAHKKLMNNAELRNRLMKERGLSLVELNTYSIGYGEFYNREWITIPVIEDGECKLIKLRRMLDETEGPKYMVYPPEGCGSTVFGATELKKSGSSSVLICGGEFDKIIGDKMKFGMPVITSTAGEGTFKDEWIDALLDGRQKVYICLDNDNKGKTATEEIANRIATRLNNVSVYNIPIPEELGDKADLTDAYKAGYTAEQLLEKAALIAGDEPATASDFAEMGIDDLIDVLNLTIRYDDMNKVILFLAMLSTYTEEDQMNVFLNAKSSSGKTYLVSEVAKLFPKIDVKKYARVSPTAFYYDIDSMSVDEAGENVLDLKKKILIFLDQIDTHLQEMLRPFMSHDDKKLPFMLTNRNKSGTNAASKGYILGFSSTFFCSANMRMDEQEGTRAILLSPEISQEKIEAGIDLVQDSSGNTSEYNAKIANNLARKNLIKRIGFIRDLNIQHIILPKELNVGERFKATLPKKKQARNQRDARQFNSLIKTHALLNAMHREVRGNDIVANEQDVQAGLRIWEFLGRSQSFGVPPQTLDFYDQFIIPAFRKKNPSGKTFDGITIKELSVFYQINAGETLNQELLRKQYLPVLEDAGLINCIKDPNDKRQQLIVPQILPNLANGSLQSTPPKEGGGISSALEHNSDISQVNSATQNETANNSKEGDN